MENKGNMSVHASMKSDLHLLNRIPRGISSDSHQTRAFSSPRPKGKIVNFRPRRRSEKEGSENLKELSCCRLSFGSTPTNLENSKQIKLRCRSAIESSNKPNKVDIPGLPGSTSLLSIAVEAQQRTTATVRLLRDSFRKKAEVIQEKLKVNMELEDEGKSPGTSVKPNSSPDSACFSFENSYTSCLDEIFQAWVNLLHVITNLKTILNRVLEVSGKERLKPDLESEKAVILQATECITFLSQLKMKSLTEGLEEIAVEDSKMRNFQILDFEERISSSFFSEMETLSQKAQEMMEQFKKESPSKAN